MAESVNIYDAKTGFSRLVARAEAGETITISRNGRAVARLIPAVPDRRERMPGAWRDRVVIADDFDSFTADDEHDWYGA
ncbi:type II toxin-antitoxin system Phd/YefM family antitoxin [Glaciibacter flavus]|uniref:Antitoxin n=1 Tax=Orlajensenia flava TaxID=2565934 RepID=A0A4S4FXD2_9MICO|nr:type II toxin-antitoxin system prevent-host-death family antitoxin [Glaciibacter flavus]THG34326.1 type II toxin-antitoxin system Phd/YefM family antitoxin [Glaciibacter flavus]